MAEEKKEEKIDVSDVFIEGVDAPEKEQKEEAQPVKEEKEAPEADTDIDENDENEDVDEHDEGETDAEREALRERRRLERQQKKEHRRQKEDQTRREIQTLRREREELAQRLSILERKTTGSEIAQVDAAIEDAQRQAVALKEQIRIATEANDGVAMAEATDRFYQVQRRGEDLLRLKRAAIDNTQRRQEQQPVQIDPSLKRNAEAWMAKNTWYDPQGSDSDSRIALTIDNALADEGWDPRHPEYWDELTSRLSKYLPHRMKTQTNTNQAPARPRSTTSGSGRDASSPGTQTQYKLSAERVSAMKEAGIWDDVDKRNAMIAKYRAYDKEKQSN